MLTPSLQTWCESLLGPVEVIGDHSREHPGLRAGVVQLSSGGGRYYLKLHRDPIHWQQEAHAYEQWTAALGGCAPRLVGVRDTEPLAVLVEALPGQVLEDVNLAPDVERRVWRAAGQTLAALHALPGGDGFGPCRRDGSPAGPLIRGAVQYVQSELDDWVERGLRGGWLTAGQQAFLRDARALAEVFSGEQPAACHRDYCPANWLVSDSGECVGVIDFEFAYWDVRTADFTRDPTWRWMDRPDLGEAFRAGYAGSYGPVHEQQCRFSHILYAAGALVWGMENEYIGFASEGRAALEWLAGSKL